METEVKWSSLNTSWSNLCRLCLLDDGIKFDIFQDDMHKKVEECFRIVIYKEDPLPKLICHKCVYKLETSYSFRCSCLNSNDQLINHLKTMTKNSEIENYFLKVNKMRSNVTIMVKNNEETLERNTVKKFQDSQTQTDKENISISCGIPTSCKPSKLSQTQSATALTENKNALSPNNVSEVNYDSKETPGGIADGEITKMNRFEASDLSSQTLLNDLMTHPLLKLKGKNTARKTLTSIFPKALNSPSLKFVEHSTTENGLNECYSETELAVKLDASDSDLSDRKLLIQRESPSKSSLKCMKCYEIFNKLEESHDHKCYMNYIRCTDCHTLIQRTSIYKHKKYCPLTKGIFKCMPCNTIFETHIQYLKHQTKHWRVIINRPENDLIICKICGKKFSDKYMLYSHSLYHRNDEMKESSILESILLSSINQEEEQGSDESIGNIDIETVTSENELDKLTNEVASTTEKNYISLARDIFNINSVTKRKLADNHFVKKKKQKFICTLGAAFATKICKTKDVPPRVVGSPDPNEIICEGIRNTKTENATDCYQCSVCSKSLNTLSELSVHIKTHTESTEDLSDLNTPLTDVYPQSQTTEETINALNNQDFPSKVDSVESSNSSNLNKSSVSNIKCVSTCKYCGQNFQKASKLLHHMKTVHRSSNDLHHCTICLKTFKSLGAFSNHYKIHSRVSEISSPWTPVEEDTSNTQTCKLCSATFSSRSEFLVHWREHQISQKKSSEECSEEVMLLNSETSEQIVTTDSTVSANVSASLTDGSKQYFCPVCSKVFFSYSGMNRHWRKHKLDKGDGFECNICGKKFLTKAFYKNHMASHTITKIYNCEICKKIFFKEQSLRNHECRGQQQIVDSCNWCGLIFKDIKHSKIHVCEEMEAASIPASITCPWCKVQFSDRQTAARHVCNSCKIKDVKSSSISILTGLSRPNSVAKKIIEENKREKLKIILTTDIGYQCILCLEEYATKQEAASHVRAHIASKPSFKCPFCSRSFTQSQSIYQHIFLNHPEASDSNI